MQKTGYIKNIKYEFYNHYVKQLVKDEEITPEEGMVIDLAIIEMAKVFTSVPEEHQGILREIVTCF